jgi:signal transduction histidine kinase
MLNRWGSSNEEVLQESIEAIQNEARSMQDLVEKLLYLSRHDKKTLKLTKKRFNIRPLIEDMVKETRLVAGNRIVSNPIMEDVIVYGDKQALKQALRIFIDNAVKYTKEGAEITILCQKVNGDCVITVSDTGIGMTRNDIDHIFNRFYRSDHVRNQNISGHGLGLSLAKIIILAHTGKIKVRSQFKKGSSFIITIPKRRF